MSELLPLVADGALKPGVGGPCPMTDVRDAHLDPVARRSTGQLVLDPSR
jgi:NADPH2:quinone reductase